MRCPLQRHPLRQRHSLRHRHSQPLLLCHRDLNAPTPAGATCRGHPDRGQGTAGATTEGRATLVFGRTQWDTQSQLARSGKTATTAAPAPYHRHLQRHPHRHPHRHLGPPVSRAATSATTGEAIPKQITAFARRISWIWSTDIQNAGARYANGAIPIAGRDLANANLTNAGGGPTAPTVARDAASGRSQRARPPNWVSLSPYRWCFCAFR